MGRSRGGFGTKVHIAVDSLGNPVRLILTGGQVADKHLYKDRNLVERFINRVKQCRRIATRYEKTARNYLAFWQLASIIVLLA